MTVAVIDLDALRLSGWRSDLQAQGDWEAYHRAATQDPPDLRLVLLVQGLRRSAVEIFLVTDQPERWMIRCQEWLAKHDIAATTLWMRPDTDWNPGHEIKAAWIATLDHPALVVSDDARMLEACRAAHPGLMTLEVTR
jgi:hypothetical protein